MEQGQHMCLEVAVHPAAVSAAAAAERLEAVKNARTPASAWTAAAVAAAGACLSEGLGPQGESPLEMLLWLLLALVLSQVQPLQQPGMGLQQSNVKPCY
jgi:hypothetical protein